MNAGRIVIITGCPGTGKTTAAAGAAEHSALALSVHMHTDDFYGFLRKGAVAPHLPESDAQNRVVVEAFLQAAARFAAGGYDVMVDGVVGPWFLEPWLRLARQGCEVHYIVLRASLPETRRRALGRAKLTAEGNLSLVDVMWPQFADLGAYESHVIRTDGQSPEETLRAVLAMIASGTARLA